MVRAVVAVFAIAILAFMGFTMFDASFADAGTQERVINESFNASQSGYIVLNQSNLNDVTYDHHPTVYNESDTIMDEGEDYLWNSSDATINATQSGRLSGDNNSSITYSWRRVTEEQERLTNLLSIIPSNIGLILVALFAVLFLMFLT